MLKKFAFVWVAALFLQVSMIYANIGIRFDNAIAVYATNKDAAIEILNEIYTNTPIETIRGYLYQKLAYHLYYDFVRVLTPTPIICMERLDVAFLTGNKTNLYQDILNLQKNQESIANVVRLYGSAIANAEFSGYLAKYITNDTIFTLLKESLIAYRKFVDMDGYLVGGILTNDLMDISKSNITDYLTRSFAIQRRNILTIASLYGLNSDTNLVRLLAVCEYDLQNYSRFLELTDQYPFIATDDKINQYYRVDVPYLLADSFYRISNYQAALQWIEKIYFPWITDIAEFRFFCYFSIGDSQNTAYNLQSIRDSDSKNFYTALLAIKNDVSNSIRLIENYIQIKNAIKKFNIEGMLLLYTYYKNRDNFAHVAEMVTSQILKRDFLDYGVNKQTIAYGVSKGFYTAMNEPSRIRDYAEYTKAVGFIKKENFEDAKKILLELIKQTNASPLIKNLAIYEYRRL